MTGVEWQPVASAFLSYLQHGMSQKLVSLMHLVQKGSDLLPSFKDTPFLVDFVLLELDTLLLECSLFGPCRHNPAMANTSLPAVASNVSKIKITVKGLVVCQPCFVFSEYDCTTRGD